MVGRRRGDAEIGNDGSRPDVAGEHVHARPAPGEVLDHLGGDRLRVGAHALGRDAVVPREREDHRRLDPWHELARDHDDPRGQLLQPAQAPARLREAVEPGARLNGQAPVHRVDRGDEPASALTGKRPPAARRMDPGASR